MNAVKIGLIGLGTVGSGTISVLKRNAEEISRRAGRKIIVVIAAVRDSKRRRNIDLSGIEITEQISDVVNHPDVQVVVELAGGAGEILHAVNTALDNGKHVVTANKALIALHGNEIFAKAQKKGLMVAFEAAVAGGIPIVKSIREGLSANRIESIAGIINGTCNFILTQMSDAQQDFKQVLAEAQKLGYAEADPVYDIEGIDAAHKLTILASLAFGIRLQFDKVYVEGITAIRSVDIRYARELGYRIKHLGIARKTRAGVELRVHPTLIPQRRLIANVDGVMNAVLVKADAVGATLYYGAGAGAEPTASAVVADLVDVVRTITTDAENRVPHLAFQPDCLSNDPILGIEQVETAYYLRLKVINRPGVMAAIATIFGESDISIESVIQKSASISDADVGAGATGDAAAEATIIMLTQNSLESKMLQAITAVEALDAVKDEVVCIRLECLD